MTLANNKKHYMELSNQKRSYSAVLLAIISIHERVVIMGVLFLRAEVHTSAAY